MDSFAVRRAGIVKTVNVYPRRKQGQAALESDRPPVHVTYDIVAPLFGLPQSVAAKELVIISQLASVRRFIKWQRTPSLLRVRIVANTFVRQGICSTALKKACRKLGIERWPNIRREGCANMIQRNQSEDEDDSAEILRTEEANPTDTLPELGGQDKFGAISVLPELDLPFLHSCARIETTAHAIAPCRLYAQSRSEHCNMEDRLCKFLHGLELLVLEPVDAVSLFQSHRSQWLYAASRIETTARAAAPCGLECESFHSNSQICEEEKEDVNPMPSLNIPDFQASSSTLSTPSVSSRVVVARNDAEDTYFLWSDCSGGRMEFLD